MAITQSKAQADTQDIEQDPRGSVAQKLGSELQREFEDVERRRRPYERRWLEDLRQYLSAYDEMTLSNIRGGDDEDNKGRSEMFVPLTRKKVRTADARLRDLLFPAGRRSENWSIRPTDEPQLTQSDEQRIRVKLAQRLIAQQQSQQQDQQISPDQVPQDAITREMLEQLPEDDVEKVRQELADQRVESMRNKMGDQLGEMQWPKIAERVLHSGHVYGIGVIKGPIPDRRTSSQWTFDEKQGWIRSQVERTAPLAEYVPLWSWYPDLSGATIEEGRFAWQEHLYPRHQILTLSQFEQFDDEEILRYVRANPDGDAQEKMHEQEIRSIGDTQAESPDYKGMYRLLERWGWMSIETLLGCGCEAPTDETTGEEQTEGEVFVSIWMLGGKVISVLFEPSYHDRLPYHLYYCEKLEGTVLDAQGWPRIVRNDQQMLNSATRAMLDNAAASAGPQVIIDLAATDGHQTATVNPWKEWYVDSNRAPGSTNPIAFQSVPNNTGQLGQIVQIGERWSHEHTLPAFMEGQSSPQSGGATDTARGLSMMMAAANIELKDLARNFDHGVTEPFVQGLYDWNMEWSDDDSIKGDFKVNARGSTALLSKEIRAQQTQQFLGLMQSFPDWIKPEGIVQDLAEITEQSPEAIKSKEEHDRDQKEQPPPTEQVQAQVEQLEAQIKAEQAKNEGLETRAQAIERFSEAVENVGGLDVLLDMAQRIGVDINGQDSGGGQAEGAPQQGGGPPSGAASQSVSSGAPRAGGNAARTQR